LAFLLFVIGSGVFALDMTFGAEALYGTSNYGDNDYYYKKGFGGFVFLGVSRFFELNLGFINKKDYWEEGYGVPQLGVYFKYPFSISDSFVFFPSFGVDYEHPFYYDDPGERHWN